MVVLTVIDNTDDGMSSGSCRYYEEILPAVKDLVEQVERGIRNGQTIVHTSLWSRSYQIKLSGGKLIKLHVEVKDESPINWTKPDTD